MSIGDPRSADARDPAGPAGTADLAGTGKKKATTAGGRPLLHRSGYVGTLMAGPARKPPKITHGKHPRGYRRPDGMILDEVRERLHDRPDIDAESVSASVTRGVVRLAGDVPNEQQKRRVDDCVSNITGVVRVDNQLAVKA